MKLAISKLVILLIFIVTIVGCNKKEPPVIASGTTGELTWKLFENGTLTISGKGVMPNYNYESKNPPWFGMRHKITSIIIGNDVTSVGYKAFFNCTRLTSVTIPNSIKSIGESAFAWCYGLTSVTIPNSVKTIGDFAFSECTDLTSVTIPNSVTSIGNYAFFLCTGLTSLSVDNSNTAFSSENGVLFNKTKTMLVAYPAGKKGDYIIPNSVTSIGESFRECHNLTSVTIPNSVTFIEDYAFSGCSGLTSVTIPNSVTSIGNYAFYYCCGLIEMINESSVPQTIVANVFSYVNLSACTLHVPEASIDAYHATNVWKDFGNIMPIL